MGRSRLTFNFTSALLLALAGVAFADDPVPADPADPDGGGEATGAPAPPPDDDSVDATLLPEVPALPEPKPEEEESRPFLFEVSVAAEIGLDSGAAGDPISIAPDLKIVTLSLPALAIVHSTHATTGFHGIGRGASLCVAGDACDTFSPSVYHNVGLEIAHSIRSHGRGGPAAYVGLNRTSLSVFGGPMVAAFDPFAVALKVGARGSYLSDGGLIFEATPNIHIGMSERALIGDRLFVPVTAGVIASPRLALQGEIGIWSQLENFGDNFRVPLGVSAHLYLTEKIMATVNFTFPAIVAGDAVTVKEFDARTLTVTFSYETIAGGG
jgi:hypothetical protein